MWIHFGYGRLRGITENTMLRIIINLLLLVAAAVSSEDDSFKFTSDSPLNYYRTAAVVSNVPECAQIGSDILRLKNGSAVDAAIAALICEGVTAPVSMDLGGGFLMTIYDAPSGKVESLIAKEMAPGLANATMFNGNASLAYIGGLAVAVPGQLLGFWEAHQKYGRVAWKDLFEPSIELCVAGYVCNDYNAGRLRFLEKEIRAEPTLAEFNINRKTNKLYAKGEVIKRLKLGKTLRKLAYAAKPADLFYRGKIAKQLVADIRERGGIITAEDLASYKVQWTEPHRAEIDNMTIYTSPPPGSGVLLTFMLNVLKGLLPAENDKILWQRFIETFKFAFANRPDIADPDFVDTRQVMAKLTSPDFIEHVRSLIRDDKTYSDPKHYGAESWSKPDAGTGQVSVLAPDGSAVAVTSSVNYDFGAKFASRSTGIVLNNQMDDFGSPGITSLYGVPPSPKNYIQPRKRPVSSMIPTILLDKNGKVKMVIGGSGGTAIPTSVAHTMALYLWNNYDLKEAVDAFRLYHQLFPEYITAEPGFPKEILDYLTKIGHSYRVADTGPHNNDRLGNSISALVTDDDGVIAANADYRRGGATVGF